MIKLRKLLPDEIPLLQNFPPEDWKLDLPKLVSFHYNFSYFYAVVAEIGKKIVGFGNAFFWGNTGWLGNIIVPPEFRRRGIGRELTLHLAEYLKNKGCISQLLIASEMGKNIYMKIGFRIVSEYQVFASDTNFRETGNNNIRNAEPDDFSCINKLDKEATAENRSDFLERYHQSAVIHETNKKINGFYLPDLGGGFIASADTKAGLELLDFRLSRNPVNTVVPVENKSAINFLLEKKFTYIRSMPRMVMGQNILWKPEFIFSRGAGYIG